MNQIETLLVANRGEIALRVMRTAERLGIRTVAVHTAVDRDAMHVNAADEAVEVPSYLDVDAVVAAAVSSGADAVHPGYGFLSERAVFARALDAAGVRLVGPTADVIDLMGRKDAARDVATKAGVPVVPAYDLDADPVTFTYPVLVKAAAGGGGKGMRVVHAAEELTEALAAARREATSAFGDDTMIIERYVERGRHVEVQVVGDSHGGVVHLHERDCSAQRRHQKVLEEAPAPGLDDATRTRMHDAAVALSRQVGYTGAGTVEFLLDAAELGGTGEFYFLEMNTRLQVEHPVTEMVHTLRGGPVDLVAMQLEVAAGGRVPAQEELALSGHAIEARVYAEDAFGGFLPQAGTATLVRWPVDDRHQHAWDDGDEGDDRYAPVLRVDHALASGQVVSTSFDPMLGKVVAHGDTREEARERLLQALAGTAIFGLTTNTGFLHALVGHDAFRDVGRPGGLDTAWLDRAAFDEVGLAPPDEAAALAALAIVVHREHDQRRTEYPSAWQPDRFRLGGDPGPLVEEGRVLTAEGWFTTGGTGEEGVLTVHGLSTGTAVVRTTRAGREVVVDGHWFDLRPGAVTGSVDAHDGDLVAPMPGTVLDVRVAEGEQVAEGAVLGVIEAMKMELALKAPHAGTVTAVDATVGRQVPLGHVLFHVEQEVSA